MGNVDQRTKGRWDHGPRTTDHRTLTTDQGPQGEKQKLGKQKAEMLE